MQDKRKQKPKVRSNQISKQLQYVVKTFDSGTLVFKIDLKEQSLVCFIYSHSSPENFKNKMS